VITVPMNVTDGWRDGRTDGQTDDILWHNRGLRIIARYHLNEDRWILSEAIIEANKSSFWKYKVYADCRTDIRRVPRGVGIKLQWGC